jgi:hypothetical protein
MLFPHEIIVHSGHLVSSLLTEMGCALCTGLFRESSEYQTTYTNYSSVFTILDSWCFKVWKLISANKFKAFA